MRKSLGRSLELSLDRGLDRSVKVLNRIVSVSEDGFTMEADPRHGQVLLKDLGLETARGVSTPADEAVRDLSTRGELLGAGDARRFRSATARLNYLAIDKNSDKVQCIQEVNVVSHCWFY